MAHALHIIADINGRKLALESMKDAEDLMGILQRATNLKDSHELPWPHRFYTAEDTGGRLMDIEIISTTLLSESEATRIISEEREARSQKKPEAVQ